MRVGDRVTVEVGAVAHGGHCVARHDGQVIFVRGSLPGELATLEVRSLGGRGRFVRANAVDILRPSQDRRPAPCPVAAKCGGCDWQHATPKASRELKAAVVREALDRFAGLTLPGSFGVRDVSNVVMDPSAEHAALLADGLGWRTRGHLAVNEAGRAGFRALRSHEIVLTDECPQLDPRLKILDLFRRTWTPEERLRFVAPAEQDPLAYSGTPSPVESIRERAYRRSWEVAADGFWQAHPAAAETLVSTVQRLLRPRSGERLVDLYAGVGLFGISLQAAAEGTLDVTLVEGDRRASEMARRNAGDLHVRVRHASVERWARNRSDSSTDILVLDPPRAGAGAQVVSAIVGTRPRAIAYVACDPVALARDLAVFATAGFHLRSLEAFDLFPSTHHVECVALLEPLVS